MAVRSAAVAALLAASLSCCLAEEPLPYQLYMLPPNFLLQAEEPALAQVKTGPFVEPIEARKPAPRVEIVMTPVRESIFSCSSIPRLDLLASPVAEPLSEPVTVVFEPVVAPRPAF